MTDERNTISPMQSFALSWKPGLGCCILKIGLLRTCCSRFPAVFPQMTAARKAGCCGDAVGCWAALPSRQSEKCAACLELMKTNGSRCWRHTFVSAGKRDPLFRRDTAVPAGICRAAGKGFPAMEVGVRQGHATAAASHSRPTAAMCPGTRHRLVLAAGNTAGIHRAALAKEALAALPQPERDALFVQAEQFLRKTAVALGDQPQPLTETDFEKLTAQYDKLLLADSAEKLQRYSRLYPTSAHAKFPIQQKDGLCLAVGTTSRAIGKKCSRRHHSAGSPQGIVVGTAAIAAGKDRPGTDLSPLAMKIWLVFPKTEDTANVAKIF